MNEYYGELCTLIYEKDKSIAVGKELEFFMSFVKDKKMKVLEPMCGNGRMLIPFMEKGINIEGFDISEEMLRVCKLKGQKLNLKPNVSYGKIEEFKGDKNYDLIMIPFGSFSLLPDELVNVSLANMKSLLKEDGKLLLTVMTNISTVEDISEWIETNRHHIDHNEIVEYKKVNYDQARKMLNTKLKYQLIKDGKIEKSEIMDFQIRLYESGEFEDILKSNDFDEIILHEVINGYGEGSSFHVYECVKKA
ncbi:class I SAM-dependent methyltransferase [Psychrobacillus sp. NPDC096426]|uniref:class I SAM-dependent methyltransferase n=1 Tax=Psychrobacillus sp. NPDC096426 TaxID=3364491 RepID=UPI00382A60F9